MINGDLLLPQSDRRASRDQAETSVRVRVGRVPSQCNDTRYVNRIANKAQDHKPSSEKRYQMEKKNSHTKVLSQGIVVIIYFSEMFSRSEREVETSSKAKIG